ncbi:MAG: Flp pilus assembly protein CpaB [Pseudomonadota bacterium]|jgi:pilus assembly protein CpaB
MLGRRTLLLLLLAALLALSAIFVAKRWMTHIQTSSRQVLPVVVANRDIHYLERIRAEDIRLIHLPPAAIPRVGAQHDLLKVTGQIATQPIYEGEFVMEQRLVTHVGGSALSHTIQQNARAVTVRVNDVTGAAGFITPGCFVDVVASRRLGSSEGIHTKTIAHVIKVLAIDQEASPEKNQPLVVHAVTLEASPEQAERIIQADEEGSIQLVLRHPLDKNTVMEKNERDKLTEALPQTLAATPFHTKTLQPKKITLIRGQHAATVSCTASGCEESVDESGATP